MLQYNLSIAAFMIGLRVEIMGMSILEINVAFRITGLLLQNIIRRHNFVCLICFFTTQSTILSYVGIDLPWLNQY